MDFRQLRYFIEIAEQGSFTKAAEKLRIIQPSLGYQIKRLEAELRVN
jgi:LysR family nitrogen assimilation transcriptional regulator